jgi:hypothetical protein
MPTDRQGMINQYALHVMDAYSSKRGLLLFYKINSIKDQNFNSYAVRYFQWLINATPSGFHKEIDTEIQNLRGQLIDAGKSLSELAVSGPLTGELTPEKLLEDAKKHNEELTRDIPLEDM